MSEQPPNTPPPVVRTEHHIWCNWFMRPVEECSMCEGLWRDYPYNNAEEALGGGLMSKHFPNNVRR